ncbi:MAG TPA: hypothetical protein VGL42_05335 [Opitutaceae bacterium]
MAGILGNFYINIWCSSPEQPNDGHRPQGLLLEFDPPVYFGTPQACGIVSSEPWAVDFVANASSEEITARIHEALGSGRFVECNLDEYFLRGTLSENKAHWRHHTLIYGYDPADDCFLCASYLMKSEYGEARLRRSVVKTALVSRAVHLNEWTPNVDYAKIMRVREQAITFDPAIQTDPEQILRQIQDFQDSRASDGYGDDGTRRYGRNALLGVARHLKTVPSRRQLDFRVTRLLMERAQLMAARLTSLAPEAARAWSEVFAALRRIHLTAFGMLNETYPFSPALLATEFSEICDADARAADRTIRGLRGLS